MRQVFRRLVLTPLVCAVVAVATCSTAFAQNAVDRGEQLLKDGDLQGAWNAVAGPAQNGSARAQFIAGMVQANSGNVAGARDWWQRSSAAGNGDAATALGYFALGGRGESRSSTRAAQLFERGARSGSAQGMLNLSRLLMIGDGIAQDRERAAKLRAQAAAAKEPTAIALVKGGGNQPGPAIVDVATWLGNFGRAADGVRILESEARSGNVLAMVVLGRVHYNGEAGGGRDYAAARQWWEKAGNHPVALYDLGILYMYGRGVQTNWGRAEVLFTQAAKAGHPDGERMARTMRDIHVPRVDPEASAERFQSSCYAQNGVPAGSACFRNGDAIMYQ
jgi:TPR repeat protein